MYIRSTAKHASQSQTRPQTTVVYPIQPSMPDTRIGVEAQESNKKSLVAAVEAAAEFLNSKGKCALVAGVKVRSCNAEAALLKFADATQYPVTGALASTTHTI